MVLGLMVLDLMVLAKVVLDGNCFGLSGNLMKKIINKVIKK